MAVNKVELNSNTLIDLTGDTVTPETLVLGTTAHSRSGAAITGTADYQPKELASSVHIGSQTSQTVESAINTIADIVPDCASSANKLASASDISSARISGSADGTEITIPDSADGYLRSIKIRGRSEIVEGEIVSIGDNGLTVTASDGNNTLNSSAVITTGLPLRSANVDIYDELDSETGTVTTRCEVVGGEVVPLVTPVVTPLSAAEIASLRSLRTYDPITRISVTDAPFRTVGYFVNTDSGKTVADVDKNNFHFDTSATLTAAAWTGTSAPFTQTVTVNNITAKDVPIIAPILSDTVTSGSAEKTEWSKITKAVSGTNNITFKCYESKPTVDLTVNIKVV